MNQRPVVAEKDSGSHTSSLSFRGVKVHGNSRRIRFAPGRLARRDDLLVLRRHGKRGGVAGSFGSESDTTLVILNDLMIGGFCRFPAAYPPTNTE
jgi:hypothetical protein